MAETEDYLSVPLAAPVHLETSAKEAIMKTRLLVATGILFLLSTPLLSAQNALPDPHNDGCWQSLESLRACQLAEYNREADYAQRCTSYPEYQCLPADEEGVKNPERMRATAKKQNNAANGTSSGNAYGRRSLTPVEGN
jgi:hypothetical protein